ncbi:hypothetical protein RF11_16493 [Thelohanellus kitauei]|uniref:Uncharacterized protein n=1 Tax=Thelohanellus kitauei TaxID=669202 RepID=A0A0C2JUT3_THEKT|nr:hypothetical protein RF11_16491 [Thelohanellus kitauei]KII73158.1 hypothetical protein RF11_16493 [Thelohanellus kitauei]
MDWKSLMPWVPFIVLESLCIASCAILIAASRVKSVFGTRLYALIPQPQHTVSIDARDQWTWMTAFRKPDLPVYTDHFEMIKEFIVIALCMAVIGTVLAAVGRVIERARAPSGLVLVIAAFVLFVFSIVYTQQCVRIFRDSTFALQSAKFKECYPKSYVIRVYFLLIFTWPISIVFALHAGYVLWECYKNKLYFGIPPEEVTT